MSRDSKCEKVFHEISYSIDKCDKNVQFAECRKNLIQPNKYLIHYYCSADFYVGNLKPLFIAMEYLFIQRPGDREKIMEFLGNFKKNSKQELVTQYNSSVTIGIVGVHAQAQMLVALNNAFGVTFGKSPIKIEDNIIISLTGKIELIGEEWQYSNNPTGK